MIDILLRLASIGSFILGSVIGVHVDHAHGAMLIATAVYLHLVASDRQ